MTNVYYLYNPDTEKPLIDKNYFINKKLGFQVINHGMIFPYKKSVEGLPTPWGGFGGITDKNGKFIEDSSARGFVANGTYPISCESIQHSSETVIYLGFFFLIWGHFLTDCIRHMWFFKSEFINQFKNCHIVYIARNKLDTEYQQNFKRLLEVLELDVDNLRFITEPTQFDKIILPDSSWFVGIGFTNEYRETIEQIRNFARKNRTPTSSKKIYFFHGVRQIGEERLAQYFKAKGYEIIQPEKLTFDEQLNWLINCESFASTLGSCAHNSIFLRDGTETIFIPREGLYGRDYQFLIDQVHSLKANYIDSTMSIFDKGNRYHCYIISEQLKRFFGDKWNGYEEEDFKIFLQYIKNSMTKGFDIDSKEKKYYSSILPNFMAQLKRHKDLIASYNMPPRWEEFQPSLTYQTYVYQKSWGMWNTENQISNELDKQLHIEAIKVIILGTRFIIRCISATRKVGHQKSRMDCKQAK